MTATSCSALAVVGARTRRHRGIQPEIQPLPAGLARYEAMEIPADNPMTPEKVAWQAALLR